MTKILHKPALEPSTTTVLVTGASGYIASHIVDQALVLGYSVRGTARTANKAEQTKPIYNNNPRYSTAVVPDFGHASAELDAAIQGVDVVIHVASDTSFSNDPHKVIGGVIDSVTNVLTAAAKEPKVKRFVLTSSSTAALLAKPGVEQTATVDTWNDEAVEAAWVKDPDPLAVYAASKTEGERTLWKFVKEKQPSFVANAILPNLNLGKVLGSTGPTGSAVIDFYTEQRRDRFPPQWFIDVVDDARLHLIAAVLDESLVNERIFAYAAPFNWNDVIDSLGRLRPDKASKFKKDPEEKSDLSTVPNELGAELLKKWFGQDGYTTLDESVRLNLEGID